MKSKTFRILVLAVCVIAVAAEAVLIINVLKNGKSKAKTENGRKAEAPEEAVTGAEEEKEKRYTVIRMVSARSTSGSVSYQYDEDGRVIRTESRGILNPGNSKGVYTRNNIEIYVYDETGNIQSIVTEVYEANGDFVKRSERTPVFQVLETDSNGGVSVKADFYSYATVVEPGMESDMYLFDEEGRVARICYPDEGRVSTFAYDEFGNAVLRIDMDSDGSEEKRRCVFTYIEGRKMTSAESSDCGYDRTSRIVYRYDTAGDLVHEEYYTADNTLYDEYDNTYDGSHHLTKRVRRINGSELTVMEKFYEEFSVTEQYLTNEERKELGLPYDPVFISNRSSVVDPYSWEVWSDHLIIY
ncbi:MAG: hypothetical protein J5643_03405 [Lachnospiraceae bacterium]|nr:hypothetical protein [Lachnospiraceae bacterium]